MNAPATLKEPYPAQPMPACVVCPAYDLAVCHGISDALASDSRAQGPLLPRVQHTVPARRVIFRQRDLHDLVPFICSGWAACAVTLSDGSRQILSFLLPGDIVSASLLFGRTAHCSVEAITEVQYRSFKRDELKAVLLTDARLLEKVSRIWTDRELRAHQLAVDLGRRSAEERIARLILGLRDRLASRNMVQGRPWSFRCVSITSPTPPG